LNKAEELLEKSKQLRASLNMRSLKRDTDIETYSGWKEVGLSETPIRYPRITKIYTVLVPEGYEWKYKTIDVYQGDSPDKYTGNSDSITVIKHGHPKQLVCFAPHFCHVLGYEPVGNESPVFLKLWKDKWG
jgi:hypothetical protein